MGQHKYPSGSHTLIFDIETSPITGTMWGKYEQNMVWMNQDWYMLSFAWKWLGQRQTYVLGLPDFPEYKINPTNDFYLVERLHQLFDMADVVIAHNGRSFDMKKSHARMIMLGMNPPSPSKILDTLTVATKYFKFTSNHLDDLGDYLGVGNKLETGGKGLWKACMEGDAKAWRKMKQYNKQDVVLLEEIYLKLRPWIDNHPAMNLMDGRPESCPKCGGGPLAKAGTKLYAKIGYRQRYQCTQCGGWSQGRPIVKDNNIKYTN